LTPRLVQDLDRVGALENHALVEPIQRRALSADLECERAGIDRVHLTRSTARRGQCDSTDEAVRIEHAQAA